MRGALMSTPKETVDAYVEQIADQRSKALQTLMRDASTRLGRKTYEFLNPRTHLVQGFAEREIPNLVERVKPDLLVMGTVARTGVPGFIMGNTAETILGHVGCSVLAVKPAGFQTPIEIDA